MKEILKVLKTDNILDEIKAELERQDAKWGVQNHFIIEWQAILMEEVGEAAKEATDYHFKNGLTGKYLKDKQVQEQCLKNYRKELIQIAAVAVQMVESLDRSGS